MKYSGKRKPKVSSKKNRIKLLFFIFICIASMLAVALTPTLLPSVLISLVLFFVFSPLVGALQRRGLSRSISIATVFIACGILVGSAIFWLTPHVVSELDAIEKGSLKYSTSIALKLSSQEKELLGSTLFKNLNLSEKVTKWFSNSSEHIWSVAPQVASHLFAALFLVPLLTFMFLKEAGSIRRKILKMVPNPYFETVYGLISQILKEMGGFVAARLIEATLVGLIVMILCFAFKVPYAVLLGFFAGVTNSIPYLGPLIGAAPGIALAILDPSINQQLLIVTLIYAAANIIDMFVLFPLVIAKLVDLHPVVVIISVMLGSQFFGIVGMIIAVPITSILKILITEVYSKIYTNNAQDQIR